MKTLASLLLLGFVAMADATAAAGRADGYTAQLAKLINDYRVQHGLQPLAIDSTLSDLAREHAMYMARQDRLSHDGFQQRLIKARSPRCVENVGSNYGTPGAELEAWRTSASHNHNLLDARIARMGLAIEDDYVTFFACT